MTQEIEQLKSMPSKLEEVNKFSQKLVEDLENGLINPLELKVILKGISSIEENIKIQLDEMAVREAEKYSEKKFSAYGCEIEIRELGVKWDYTTTNDPVLQSLEQEQKAITDKVKERQLFLKSIKEPMNIASESTGGEEVTIYPAVKKSTTGLVLRLK